MWRLVLARRLLVALLAVAVAPSLALAAPNAFTAPNALAANRNLNVELVLRHWTPGRIKSVSALPQPAITRNELERMLGRKVQELGSVFVGTPTMADVKKPPYDKAGQLLFDVEGDPNPHWCSAQFVGNTSVLLTAAHCVRDRKTGAWFTNFIFNRAQFGSNAPQTIAVSCVAAPEGWVTDTDNYYRWDYAFLKTAEPSAVGNLTLSLSLPASNWEAIGYPLNYGGGGVLYHVGGKKGISEKGLVQMLGNPMRNGNSGGAWLMGSTVIGLNSFHETNDTKNEWGPVFDDNVAAMWNKANNGCQ